MLGAEFPEPPLATPALSAVDAALKPESSFSIRHALSATDSSDRVAALRIEREKSFLCMGWLLPAIKRATHSSSGLSYAKHTARTCREVAVKLATPLS
jgi:hypothetical protein